MVFIAQKLINLKPMLITGRKILIFLACLPLGILHFANAQESNSLLKTSEDESVVIESDRQSTDTTGGIFTAYGNVKILYPERGIMAKSRQLQYLKKEGIIVLTGDVALIQNGRNSLYGQRVVYFLEDDQIVADSHSGSQVLLRFSLDSAKPQEGTSAL